MKYLVFRFPDYYPSGGWDDFVGASATLDEAIELAELPPSSGNEFSSGGRVQIVDAESKEVVLTADCCTQGKKFSHEREYVGTWDNGRTWSKGLVA